MSTLYHRMAGGSLERLAALSDGIFAVAMTLLVLDLRVPAGRALHEHPLWTRGSVSAERPLWHALAELAPHLLPYLMSFVTLGMFWVGQQAQLSVCAQGDRNLTWIHLTFLLGVGVMPFSTGLLADYITYRLALVVYWLNLLGLGLVLYAAMSYAVRAGLLAPDAEVANVDAVRRRIVVYQILYAVSMLFCLINTYISIGIIVALQLNSAIAPRIWPLDRF